MNPEKGVKDRKTFWKQDRNFVILIVLFFNLITSKLSLAIKYGLNKVIDMIEKREGTKSR
jgi:hypothetical protein